MRKNLCRALAFFVMPVRHRATFIVQLMFSSLCSASIALIGVFFLVDHNFSSHKLLVYVWFSGLKSFLLCQVEGHRYRILLLSIY